MIEKKVSDYAKSKGMLSYKFTSPSCRGVCDRVYLYKGKVFFIEFKALGKKPSPLQERHHRRLKEQGVSFYVVDDVELGKKVIDDEQNKGT